jgi:DNA repair ATPase RecN
MSEDLTQKLPKNGNNSEILTAIKDLHAHVNRMDAHITNIDNRLGGLEQKVDERLYDTRPIWHKVVADIAQLQAGQQRLEQGQKRLEEGQQTLHSEISTINTTVNNVKIDQLVLNDAVRRMQLDFLTINEWLRKVIVNRPQQNPET